MQAALGKLRPATLTTTKNGKTVKRTLPFLSDSTVQAAQDALKVQAGDERLEGADASPPIANSDFSDIGGAKQTLGCTKRNSDGNQRVNQDCSFRRQAEEDITYNPADPSEPGRGPERQPGRLQPVRDRLLDGRRAQLGRPPAAVPPARERS
jgi:hypothetical protein